MGVQEVGRGVEVVERSGKAREWVGVGDLVGAEVGVVRRGGAGCSGGTPQPEFLGDGHRPHACLQFSSIHGPSSPIALAIASLLLTQSKMVSDMHLKLLQLWCLLLLCTMLENQILAKHPSISLCSYSRLTNRYSIFVIP